MTAMLLLRDLFNMNLKECMEVDSCHAESHWAAEPPMNDNPHEPPKDNSGNPAPAIDVSELWDIDAHQREGGKCPWTFFAYPKALADEQRLPRDNDAVRYLLALQRAGVRVGIQQHPRMPNDIYFACPFEEMQSLIAAIDELERAGTFPRGFGTKRTDYLYSLANPAQNAVSENPYEPPKEAGTARPTKGAVSIFWSIPLAFVGIVLGGQFLGPYVPTGPGDPGGHSIGGMVGGFIGLAIGLGLRILVRAAEQPSNST
jgi:hypothetical protein